MNLQTTQGIIPSGTVSGNNWEIWAVPEFSCLAFRRSDWKKPVHVPISSLRSFVLA